LIGRWFGRRKGGFGALTFHNRRAGTLRLWLEPWGEEVGVPPGSRAELVVDGAPAGGAAELEVTSENLAFFAPGGSRVRVLIDGAQANTASASIAAPDMPGFGTRDFVHTAFDGLAETRPSGLAPGAAPAPDRLWAPMADEELRLDPLAAEHRSALKAACAQDREVWPIYATSFDPDHFDASFELILARPNWRCFAILLGERLVGMSCYIGIEPERAVLEIGNTYYVPDMRGTGLTRRVKQLRLDRAFGCGFRRAEFRVDSRNARSQAAMAKLGAVREGAIRAERVTWTGHVRDTVLFSILADEWGKGDRAPG